VLNLEAKALLRSPVLWLVAAACVTVAIAYSSTFADMADKWLRDASYQHGLIVPLISLWLVWRMRDRLVEMPLQPTWAGVPVLLALGAIWLVARVVDIKVVEQLAAMALIPTVVVTLLGVQAGRALAFPLAFIMLAVPVGQALVPTLMQFTADFTVTALRATGIPVFRDGVYFIVPAGHFEVAKACSGIRYLNASLTFGLLFAYLMLHSPARRTIMVLLSIVVPVIANGIRAYLIVLVASLSDMRYGVGVDHIVYGWVFFAPVIGLLLWVGLRMRAHEIAANAAPPPAEQSKRGATLAPAPVAAALLAVILPPVVYARVDWSVPAPSPEAITVAAQLPARCGAWSTTASGSAAWRPDFRNSLVDKDQEYVSPDGERVSVYRAVYAMERHGRSEMITAGNQLEAGGEERRTFTTKRRIELPDSGSVSVAEAIVGEPSGEERLAWFWYEIGGVRTSSPYHAKALEVWFFLRSEAPLERITVVSTPILIETRARDLLERFVRSASSELLANADANARSCGP
jgi:exosortase A